MFVCLFLLTVAYGVTWQMSGNIAQMVPNLLRQGVHMAQHWSTLT